jgi:diguanylate cyclase (GGDEF)-like protein
MPRYSSLAVTCFSGFIACLISLDSVYAQTREVSLQLLWNHQFQFAGYYAAEAQGFYADEGLDVHLKHGGYNDSGKAVNPVEEVVFGRAEFGITRSDLLLERMLGLPVVALAAIYQRSPFVLVTTTESGIRRLEDIGESPVTLALPGDQGTPRRVDAETLAMLKQAGIDYRQLNNEPPSWDYRDLTTGKTTLMPGYITDTPLHVKRAGEEPVIINPLDYGIDFYGDVLFTSEYMLSSDPDVVARFRRASLRGWKYALEQPEEVINLILEKYYPDAGPDMRELLSYEAQRTTELMQPDLIEVGYMSRDRWRRIEQTFVELGLASGTLALDEFLYNPGKSRLWQQYRVWIVSVGAVFSIILVVLIFAIYLNRKLHQQILTRKQLELTLKETNRKLLLLSDTDALTGLHNRRYIDRALEQEIKHAERYGDQLTIALIDVDNFKQVNDNYGHACGDKALVAVAQQIRICIREVDLAGRYGGEEFLLVFPKLAIDDTAYVMERLRSGIESIVVECMHGLVTISAGIVIHNHGETLSQLVSRADKLLYRAKQGGRNRIMVTDEVADDGKIEPVL